MRNFCKSVRPLSVRWNAMESLGFPLHIRGKKDIDLLFLSGVPVYSSMFQSIPARTHMLFTAPFSAVGGARGSVVPTHSRSVLAVYV